MPYRITEDCISCGDCAVVCHKDAIDDGYTYNTTGDINSTTDVVRDGAMEEVPNPIYSVFRITDDCDDCGACVSVCPARAIVKS